MRYSPDFIDRVRDANNIVDVISQYTEFKRMGHNLMARCPFPDHAEKTASFSVSESKQVYHCFGCKKSGNIFNFLTNYSAMSFGEAVEYLAKKAAIPLPEIDDRPKHEIDKNPLFKLNLRAGSFYKKTFQQLPESHAAKRYLKERGLNAETIETFKIGYAPAEWSELSNHFESVKAPMSEAEKLGLIKKRPNKTGYFDIYRGRIMFPILSVTGDVVGFGGRVVNEGQPKYLNSSDSPVFRKGRTLYGIFETTKHIRTEDQVLVVEGYMDLLALYQAGIRNVVATLGTALTAEHAKLLKRYTTNVVVLFDGDQAGQEAQERSLSVLLLEGLLPKGVTLPEELDPDEYVQTKGVENFKKLIDRAPELIWLVLLKKMKDFNATEAHKEKITREFAAVLNSVQSESLKELYINEFANRISATPQWVIKSIKLRRNSQSKIVPDERKTSEKEDEKLIKILNPFKEELILLNLALEDKTIFDEICESGILENFTAPGIKKLFEIMLHEYRHKGTFFDKLTSILCSKVEDAGVVTGYLDQGYFQGIDKQKLKSDCFQRVRDRALKLKAAQLLTEIKVDDDPQKLEQFMNVIKDRKALSEKNK